MVIASITVAVLALLFTVSSFYWLHARRGKLSSYRPVTFSGLIAEDRATIRLPVLIHNGGAIPRVVTALRLRLRPEGGEGVVLPMQTFRRTLDPMSDDHEDFAQPFVVQGRSVELRYVEFKLCEAPTALLADCPSDAVVDAQIDHDNAWKKLVAFQLRVDSMFATNTYITYSNDPAHWQPEQLVKAREAFAKLRANIGTASSGGMEAQGPDYGQGEPPTR